MTLSNTLNVVLDSLRTSWVKNEGRYGPSFEMSKPDDYNGMTLGDLRQEFKSKGYKEIPMADYSITFQKVTKGQVYRWAFTIGSDNPQ